MTTNIFNLDSKIAMVTGASRGIGEEIAKLLAEQGAHVLVTSRKVESCEKVVNEITESGGSAEALACHVGNMEDIEKTFFYIRSEFGGLDILVNNAATNPIFSNVLDTDISAFQKIIDVNIRGYFFMSIEAGKLMRENGKGVIVNTASINGLSPGIHQGVYSISKAAVINMTKVFAKECAQYGIRCNALLPGLTKTKFADALFADDKIYDDWLKTIPMGRHAETWEMAGTVLYLVSDASSFTNGACIVVDGGMTI